MKVSVIVPVFNRADFIASALRSLLRQRDAAELDIIVVDDGSTDATAEVVTGIAQQAPCVRLVSQQNQGVSCARNTGLAHLPADVDLIGFLDSDDLWPAGRLAADLHDLRHGTDVEVVYGLLRLVDRVDDNSLDAADGCRSVTVRGLSLSAGIYRRRWFNDLGGFDRALRHAEDADFLFRLFERRPPTVYTHRVAVIYRRHPGNMTNESGLLLKSMMMALLKSIKRRQADPSLASLEGIFDLSALRSVDWM